MLSALTITVRVFSHVPSKLEVITCIKPPDHLIDGSRSVGPFSKSECEQLLGVLYRDKGESNVTGVASASEYRSPNVVQRIWASLNLPQSAFSPGS